MPRTSTHILTSAVSVLQDVFPCIGLGPEPGIIYPSMAEKSLICESKYIDKDKNGLTCQLSPGGFVQAVGMYLALRKQRLGRFLWEETYTPQKMTVCLQPWGSAGEGP